MPTNCDHTKCRTTCAPCVCRCPATPPVAQDVRTGCGGRESDGCSGRGAGDGLGALAHGVLGQLAGQLGASGRGAVGTLPGKQWRGCGCPELPWRRQAACMPAEDSVLAPVCLARRPASPAILRGRNAAGRAKKGGAKAPTKQTQHAPKTQAWRLPPVEEVRRERVHDGHRLLGHLEFALQTLHDLGDVQWRPGRSGPQPQNKNAGAGALAYALITALPDTGLLGTPLYERYERLPFLRRPPAFFAAFLDFFWIGFFAIFFGLRRKLGMCDGSWAGRGYAIGDPRAGANNRAAAVPTPSAHTTLLQRMHRQSALPQALTWERLVDGRGMRCLIMRRRRGSCPPSSGRTARRRPGKDQQTISVRLTTCGGTYDPSAGIAQKALMAHHD